MPIQRLESDAAVYKQLLLRSREGPTMKATAPVAMVIAALLFSGCSASQLINTGGDTKCKDFVSQDEKKQNEEVSKMLKDNSGAEPAIGGDLLPNARQAGQQDIRGATRLTGNRLRRRFTHRRLVAPPSFVQPREQGWRPELVPDLLNPPSRRRCRGQAPMLSRTLAVAG